jgi:hypothetical protein
LEAAARTALLQQLQAALLSSVGLAVAGAPTWLPRALAVQVFTQAAAAVPEAVRQQLQLPPPVLQVVPH